MTADPTLEAIDNALADWSVGPDGMRWTPEPPKRPILLMPLPPQPDPAAVRAAIEAAATAYRDAVQQGFDHLKSGLRDILKTAVRVQQLMQEAQRTQIDARRSAMHSAYRHRQLARRRRK